MQEVKTLGTAMNNMVEELATSRAEQAEKTRLTRELRSLSASRPRSCPKGLRVPWPLAERADGARH